MPRNLALVGCGAIAQAFYIPALAKLRESLDRIWLVDPSDTVLAAATAGFGAETAHTLAEIDGEVDFVIVAAPNAKHFDLAHDALSRGAHVLIEKPFVTVPEDGRKLAEIAAAKQRTIAINQTRRLFPVAGHLRERIGSGEFGALMSIQHSEGVKLVWPFQSGSAFAKDARRTGVIMDFGVHALDLYQYLFQPSWRFIWATHDGFAGPEGLAEIHLEAGGAPVAMRLSRYQSQENVAHMTFAQAEIRVGVFDWSTYAIRDSSGTTRRIATPGSRLSSIDIALRLLNNFFAASEGSEDPFCDAASSLPVIAILDEIYRSAGRYSEAVGAV